MNRLSSIPGASIPTLGSRCRATWMAMMTAGHAQEYRAGDGQPPPILAAIKSAKNIGPVPGQHGWHIDAVVHHVGPVRQAHRHQAHPAKMLGFTDSDHFPPTYGGDGTAPVPTRWPATERTQGTRPWLYESLPRHLRRNLLASTPRLWRRNL